MLAGVPPQVVEVREAAETSQGQVQEGVGVLQVQQPRGVPHAWSPAHTCHT